LQPLDLAEYYDARVQSDGEHDCRESRSNREAGGSWAEHRRYNQDDQNHDGARVRHVMKSDEGGAEHRAGERAAGYAPARLQHLKCRRRDDAAKNHHTAEPHNKREHVDVPQRKHRVIIILRNTLHSEPITFHRRRRGIDWRVWSPAAFAEARLHNHAILLLLTAPWSDRCAELDARLADDETVAVALRRELVPVRVDVERRPDLAERYGTGELPMIALLNADGEVLRALCGARAESILDFCEQADPTGPRFEAASLDKVRAPHVVPHASAGTPRSPEGTRDVQAWFLERARAEFDAEYGGFGSAPKFPHLAALQALLDIAPTDEVLVRSLTAIDALIDIDGGFRRVAAHRNWRAPVPEKLLGDQAIAVDVYLTAADRLGDEAWLTRAAAVVQFVMSRLADPAGGFFGSVRDETVDRTLYIEANALMTSALLRVASRSRDEPLARTVVSGLERVVLAAYQPSVGVCHWIGGDGIGFERLLADQVAVAEAMLVAHEIGRDETHLMMAEELMRGTIRRCWDHTIRAFRDRPCETAGEGALACPLYPLVANCRAVRVLLTLADRMNQPEYRAHAGEIIDTFACCYRDYGLLAAPYASAVQVIC
jgi:uncharacterized protein YyaL (SSP411 family)